MKIGIKFDILNIKGYDCIQNAAKWQGIGMIANIDLSNIVDTAVTDISKRVAKLEFTKAETTDFKGDKICSLVTTAKGDYDLTVILYAGSQVLRAIAVNMKRGVAVSDEDIVIYTTEYFNILCGHIISMINTLNKKKARFGVPQIMRGMYQEALDAAPIERWEHIYNCPVGLMKLETLYRYS